ncbi:putative phytosulfokines 6 isoform X2 [Lotus japonicus]|uniref:Phytosulfokine n=1 Tax=Lotus japonicus TaxID=34305 RepID=I3RZY5_LOTJA|nr:putative phytosulfokines 6 isoform X2 [Lotus japonicus]AFK33577.1 unknown [Lotus japonicus]AIS76462.1 phytosulfokine-alpha precursor 5 [Lotus japonicus]
MKLSFHSGALLLFFFFLVCSSTLSARSLTSEQGKNIKVDIDSEEKSVLGLEGDNFFKLLGIEHCKFGDEECLQRRMDLEAHLDYIYTQHHKP